MDIVVGAVCVVGLLLSAGFVALNDKTKERRQNRD